MSAVSTMHGRATAAHQRCWLWLAVCNLLLLGLPLLLLLLLLLLLALLLRVCQRIRGRRTWHTYVARTLATALEVTRAHQAAQRVDQRRLGVGARARWLPLQGRLDLWNGTRARVGGGAGEVLSMQGRRERRPGEARRLQVGGWPLSLVAASPSRAAGPNGAVRQR